MASTYTPIATYTASGTVSDYTFSSIASTWTDLRLIISGKSASGTGAAWVQFNGAAGTAYSDTFLQGNGSSAASVRDSNSAALYFGYHSTNQSNFILDVMNYANTTTYKTVLARGNDASAYTTAVVGMWRSTAAITSIKISNTSASWAIGTSFTLYGIKAA